MRCEKTKYLPLNFPRKWARAFKGNISTFLPITIFYLVIIVISAIKQGLTHYCISTHSRYITVENIVRKGEIACNKQFHFFSQCLLPYMALTSIFHFECTIKCRLQFVSILTGLKLCRLVMG